VTKKTGKRFFVDIIPESLTRTNLGTLKEGAPLNLEASIKAGEAFDGHFVSGHIDATARLISTGKIRHGTGLTIAFPQQLRPYITEKGTITVNGVSLTVVDVTKTQFTVALIPFTMANTNLGTLKKGDTVNLEIDLIARYLHHFVTFKK
ncbi:MAG: riboflavin synthase subunit alpha, partial [Candidatus Peregrinibacteria bacterium GW2011_GWA2_47_7]